MNKITMRIRAKYPNTIQLMGILPQLNADDNVTEFEGGRLKKFYLA